jgi:hypothetical protein
LARTGIVFEILSVKNIFQKQKIQFMQNKEKENVQKDKADKKNQTTQNDSSKRHDSMGEKNPNFKMDHKEGQSHQGSQKQSGSKAQKSGSQDNNDNWKNQDDSEIENPSKHGEDDENKTSKKIPQMKHHDK